MKKYTHKSPEGALFRFEKGRPISAYADYIMDICGTTIKPGKIKKKSKKPLKTKKK